MRKNSRKIVELECCFCKNKFKRFKKEHDRQLKRGRTKWYCDGKCCYKDNPRLQEVTQYAINHPDEMRNRFISSPNFPFIRQKDELTLFRYYIRKVKERIKSKLSKKSINMSFNLTPEYLKEIWDKQEGICPYTGIKMQIRDFTHPSCPHNASLDRIDSSKGYEVGNVEFVCISVNYAKNSFSKEEIIEFFNKIKNNINI